MEIKQAIEQRQSVRAFLTRPVPHDTVKTVLDTACRAPSGVNMQPWHVAVVEGITQQRLAERLIDARRAGLAAQPDIMYYPETWFEPYRSRRKDCGLKLYRALGIERDDHERQMTAWCNNYRFFGAPVGLIFHLDARLAPGSLVDMGLFLQSIMLYAQDHGLATCPQASLAEYPEIVREVLNLPAQHHILCGMALGYPDWDAPVNQYRLDRVPMDEFTSWHA